MRAPCAIQIQTAKFKVLAMQVWVHFPVISRRRGSSSCTRFPENAIEITFLRIIS
jgi:hypothetical protein